MLCTSRNFYERVASCNINILLCTAIVHCNFSSCSPPKSKKNYNCLVRAGNQLQCGQVENLLCVMKIPKKGIQRTLFSGIHITSFSNFYFNYCKKIYLLRILFIFWESIFHNNVYVCSYKILR